MIRHELLGPEDIRDDMELSDTAAIMLIGEPTRRALGVTAAYMVRQDADEFVVTTVSVQGTYGASCARFDIARIIELGKGNIVIGVGAAVDRHYAYDVSTSESVDDDVAHQAFESLF